MFLPQAPYFPVGSLRAILAYPSLPGAFSDAEDRKALERVRLGHLAADLDVKMRWEKELSHDEQRRLNLARLLLHRPQWVIKDESISELDDESREIASSIFSSELKHTGFLSIGRYDPGHGFYQRTLNLQTRLPGLRLPLRFKEEIPEPAAA